MTNQTQSPHVVVIGAGIGGLTAAALLLKRGYRVTVLEAHVYTGGCAGTFFHKGYRFDAGATLAGGFTAGGPHARLAEILGLEWPIRPVDPAWRVHLPDGRSVTQWADADQWQAERLKAFPQAEKFWQTQEMLADISWDISTRHFPWPPESARDLFDLTAALRLRTLASLPYLLRTLGSFAPQGDPMFDAFLNSQLLISAQTTSDYANALYGSAALDLPRRGVNHVHGGIGSLSETIAEWIRNNGGEVMHRQEAVSTTIRNGKVVSVKTRRNLDIECDFVLANLTPWGLQKILDDETPQRLNIEIKNKLQPTWGAFMIYMAVDKHKFQDLFPGTPTHHQVIVDENKPLGETNSIFFSMGDFEDESRAPAGELPVTMSTHTEISQWWKLRETDKETYERRKQAYMHNMINALERALPGIRSAITFSTTGTPVSFQRFTRRPQGMVGGFAQKSILQARGPKTGIENLLLVGDSIFPGQSTAGVTIGGFRVAQAAARYLEKQPNIKTVSTQSEMHWPLPNKP